MMYIAKHKLIYNDWYVNPIIYYICILYIVNLHISYKAIYQMDNIIFNDYVQWNISMI